MPNLKPPVRSVSEAKEYFDRIMACVDDDGSSTTSSSSSSSIDGSGFQPLMTLYLTDATTRDDVIAAKNSGLIHAYKLYPAGATTNSEFGVTSLDRILVALQVEHHPCVNSNLQYDESVAVVIVCITDDVRGGSSAVDAWGGSGPDGGCLRPRGGLHRDSAEAHHRAMSVLEDSHGAHHYQGCSGVH